MTDVSIVPCFDYESEHLRQALIDGFAPFGGFSMIKKGMTIAIKTNLVHASKPEKAAVTHPALLAELTKLLVERGARVIVGDSPGGLYTAGAMANVYRVCKMDAVIEAGGELNLDFSQETVEFPEGKVTKSFPFTSWLNKADVVFNLCKLKTHGMMGMSCATKNLFGVVPGFSKPEFHYRYPNHLDFAGMILDLGSYVKPTFSVCDAVWGMEGNGPTGGTPRHIGCIMVSPSTHKLDLLGATLIGLAPNDVPTLGLAVERGLAPANVDGLEIYGDYKPFIKTDFELIRTGEATMFSTKNSKGFKKLVWFVAEKALASRPKVNRKQCVGCKKCAELCPAHAITIKNGKAKIHKKNCIRCFCCQEFCPISAISVNRTMVAKIFCPQQKGRKLK